MESEIIFPSNLDLTSQDVNFDQMEQDIKKFASDPTIKNVLEDGQDLQEYHKIITYQLEEAENSSIEDYLKQITRVEELHDKISSCDNELKLMEDLLIQFKESLGQLSNDICSLQTRSQDINIKLNNRKNLEILLGQYTKEISISDEFELSILNFENSFKYNKIIQDFHSKLVFLNRSDIKNTQAALEMKPKFDKLKFKASENIKKWLFQMVSELKENYIENQLTIQNSMIRSKNLIKFLKNHSNEIEKLCEKFYIDSLSRIYVEHYKIVIKNVLKKMSQVPFNNETIVPQQQRSIFKRKINKEFNLFFTLGEREKILNELLNPPQIFEEGSYSIETLLRSVYQKFIDNVTSEHVFVSQFFDNEQLTIEIFLPLIRYLDFFFDDLLLKINDPICILLLLTINTEHLKEMKRRNNLIIDFHINSLNQKLLNRFHLIIKSNLFSIENADLKSFIENENIALHSNSVTKRYSEFVLSILKLINKLDENIKDEIIPEIHSISASLIDLLDRISKTFKNDEFSNIFLINNYYYFILTLRLIENSNFNELFEIKFKEYF